MAALGIVSRLFPSNGGTIAVDMKPSRGNQVELFLNGSLRSASQPIIAGQRNVYTFSGIQDDISLLRFDPTDTPGTEVQMYSIEVRDAAGILKHYDGAALHEWVRYNEKVLDSDDGSFRFVSINDDPIMVSPERIVLRRSGPRIVGRTLAFLNNARLWIDWILLFTAVLFFLFSLADRRRMLHFPIFTAIFLASAELMSVAVRSIHAIDPVSKAVGRASFVGISVRAGTTGTMLAAAGASLLAIAAWLLQKKLSGTRAIEDVGEVKSKEGPIWLTAGIPILVSIFVAVILCPDIKDLAKGILRSQSSSPNWDQGNLAYWSYIVSRGFIPYRDFWYPYTGRYTLLEPLPTGPVIRWLYLTFQYSIFFFSFYRISGRRFWLPFVGLLVAILGELSGLYFSNSDRYLLSLTLLLSYLAIDRWGRRWTPTIVLFGLLWGVSFFYEPAQVVYAAAAIALIILLDLLTPASHSARDWWQRVVREFSIPAVLTLAILISFSVQGQLSGIANLYLRAADSVAYSAFPTDVSWVKHLQVAILKTHLTELSSTVLFGPPIFIGIGLFERLRSSNVSKRYGEFLLGVGILFLFVLQKHLVRQMDDNLLLYWVTGLFGYMLLWPGKRSILDSLVCGLILGIVAHSVTEVGALHDVRDRLRDGPKHIAANFLLNASDEALIAEANQKRFAKEKLIEFGDEQKVAERLRAISTGAKPPKAFLLTDDQIIYILLEEAPVYHANMYNASPIYEQQRVVRWLAEDKPEFVVFDPNSLSFDYFPLDVRIPLVFVAVIENYVPFETVGRFQVLRRRRSNEPIAMSYWRERLGAVKDFGRLLELSSFDKLAACPQQNPSSCVDFLEVDVPKSLSESSQITVPLDIAGQSYGVQFEPHRGRTRYHLMLNRFWPWEVSSAMAGPRRIAKEKLNGAVEARITSRAAGVEVLY